MMRLFIILSAQAVVSLFALRVVDSRKGSHNFQMTSVDANAADRVYAFFAGGLLWI